MIPSSCDGNQGTSTRPKGINFNEWARGLPVLVSADNANRVVSNISIEEYYVILGACEGGESEGNRHESGLAPILTH